MELQVLKTVGQVAGIGGLALGVLLLVFREVVRKNIFPNLAQPEAYRLLRLILVLTWSVALVGIGAWAYVKNQDGASSSASGAMREYAIAGLVTDPDNNSLVDAEVLVVGTDAPVRTNASGAFSLRTTVVENGVAIVRVSKSGYKARLQNVKLPTSGLIVSLDPSASPPSSPSPGVAQAVSQPRDRRATEPPESVPPNAAPQTGRIYLQYSGDMFACSLSLKLRIGARDIVPMGNLFPVNDLPLGKTTYDVSGAISCPAVGSCTASGSGRITIEDEAHFSVLWQNTGYARCDVRLIPSP